MGMVASRDIGVVERADWAGVQGRLERLGYERRCQALKCTRNH